MTDATEATVDLTELDNLQYMVDTLHIVGGFTATTLYDVCRANGLDFKEITQKHAVQLIEDTRAELGDENAQWIVTILENLIDHTDEFMAAIEATYAESSN